MSDEAHAGSRPGAEGLPGWEVRRLAITHPDAMGLVEAVQEEYVARYGGRDESPIDPSDFEDPQGAFYVGYAGDDPVATGAWRRSTVPALGTSLTAEIKRMYVVPRVQRRGLARRMLAHLEATAAAHGIEALILETGLKQPEAIALYESSGYVPIPGYGHYCGSELSRCFGKRL